MIIIRTLVPISGPQLCSLLVSGGSFETGRAGSRPTVEDGKMKIAWQMEKKTARSIRNLCVIADD
jgi:hypothetical protein